MMRFWAGSITDWINLALESNWALQFYCAVISKTTMILLSHLFFNGLYLWIHVPGMTQNTPWQTDMHFHFYSPQYALIR